MYPVKGYIPQYTTKHFNHTHGNFTKKGKVLEKLFSWIVEVGDDNNDT